MKRRSALLLLLLLPLTMAPRTSFDGGRLDVDVSTPRQSVRVGAVMPVTVTVTNDSPDTTEMTALVVTVLVDGLKDSVEVMTTSRGCLGTGTVAGCWLPPMEPSGTATVQLLARPQQAGRLMLEFSTRNGDVLGSVTRDVVSR